MKTMTTVILLTMTCSLAADDSNQIGLHGAVSPETPAILCADQADNRIRLYDPMTPGNNKKTFWCYPGDDEKSHKYRPTDAKRVEIDGVVHILAAYHGRVRLVRFSDKKLIKDYSSYSSCHSADLLPDGSLVSANSNHGILRRHLSEDRYFDLKLPYAHGVTWDKERHCLWALGDFLYRIHVTDQKLVIDEKFELPLSPTGHDLFPLRKEAKLLVTNNDALFLFNIETQEFSLLSSVKEIKSASQDKDGSIWISEPKTIKGAAGWQSDSFIPVDQKVNPKRYTREGSRFYKARWWQNVSFSY